MLKTRGSFKSVTIPQRDDARFAHVARRCDACRPLGMFRSSENEFLLCYDGELLRIRLCSVNTNLV